MLGFLKQTYCLLLALMFCMVFVLVVLWYHEADYTRKLSKASKYLNRRILLSEEEINELLPLYLQRWNETSASPARNYRNVTCSKDQPKHQLPCVDRNCTASFPSLDVRLRNILQSQYQIIPQYQFVIKLLASQVNESADIVFITAASDNHYGESLGVLKDLYEQVFPALDGNFTYKLIYYDLGLSASKVETLRKLKGCHVIRFPFELLPLNFKHLGTCLWKPIVIKAHLRSSNITMWLDASARFRHTHLESIINRTLTSGLFLSRTYWTLPMHVAGPMLDYFGVRPCLLAPFYELAGGFLAVKNERLVERLFLDSVVACAFSPDCMCPGGPQCNRLYGGCFDDTKLYSRCHRFDQSAVAIVLIYLFDWKSSQFLNAENAVTFKRGDKVTFIPELYSRGDNSSVP